MTIRNGSGIAAFAVFAGMMWTGHPARGEKPAPSLTVWESARTDAPLGVTVADGQVTPRRSRRVYGAIEFTPLSLLISSDIDGFRVISEGRAWRHTEEIEGIGSLVPTLRLGVRVDTRAFASFLTVGGGGLVNGAFVAPLAMLDASFRVKLGRHVLVGPRVGALFVGEADWFGDADVSFSSTSGGFLGFGIAVGGHAVAFSLAFNYVHLDPVNVTTGGNWRSSARRLDYSGPMVNVGVLFRL